jgi:hypothetical protein
LACEADPDIRSRLLVQRAVHSDPEAQRRFLDEILRMPEPNMMSRTMAQAIVASKKAT